MITYGLIGYPLSHSWSADYFFSKFRQEGLGERTYKLFPVPSLQEFPELILREQDLAGLNVTIPYKEKIVEFLDELEPAAKEIGAVNTILITRSPGKTLLKGYNTDAEGFRLSADFTGHRNALVLGTGGAAKAVAYALGRLGIESLFVSRGREGPGTLMYHQVTMDMMAAHTLIINATPAGMFPDVDRFPPIPFELLTPGHFLYDLVYNPEDTRFLEKGRDYGVKTQNGLAMLKIQADLTFEIWENR